MAIRWQYARYVTRVGSEYLPDDFSLYLPEKTISSENMEDLIIEIAGRHPREDEAGLDLFLNALGGVGWELIHLSESASESLGYSSANFYFKRQIL
ncbi:hypothetical protein [Deinococcus sp. 23YEL01]|uniref:hypothetical protein n=1 Tax=Deinococcus sp. 23YEL01 TaxID=2745871 RepID=UPI001E61615B|nr:hypothetical protein [Deinococcus sp. 23YEL01]MCD0168805.1 hypothetical protein [Deinococcus sp. 23YEL01]